MKLIRVSRGLNRVVERIFGITRKFAELIPIISIASICSVIRIVPSSEDMLEPILPASMRQTIVEQNSRIRDSLAIYPMYILGSRGDVILFAVCMTSTAPINTDMRAIRGMELITSFSVSVKNCLANSLHLSGLLNTCFKNRRYRPVSYRKFLIKIQNC